MTRAERNIAWIEEHCRVPEGKLVGQPVRLRSFQQEVIGGIYDGQTRRAIISVPRKNAKTSLAAMLMLLHLEGPEARVNSQLYSGAMSRDQAAVLFALAAKMVRMSPDLAEYVTIRDHAKQLHCPELGTLYRALSAEASTAYGLSPVFTVHDELGQVRGPRSELYEALETAAGAQEEPLSIIISTQAPNDGDLLSILIDDAKTGADPRTKLFLWEAPEDADPFKPATWKKANPMFGDLLSAEEVKDQAESAKRMPARESAFRNLVLNQRVSQVSPLIARAVWTGCADEPDVGVLRSKPVYAGLDLSARNDLTALGYFAVDDDGTEHTWCEFFVPEEGLIDRARRDRVPYDVWAEEGWITPVPGASVDYEWVAHRLVSLCDDSEVYAIGFDRWRIDVLKKELERLGVELPLIPHGQGFKDMSPAIDALEAVLLNGKMRHGGNPVLTWCAANAIATTDPAGNRKMDKGKAKGRIDGLVALAMAHGVTTADEPTGPSVYEERGLLEI